MNLDLGDALQTFFAESRGLLQDMEEALLRLENTPDDAEAVNAVFRAAHTIKGSSGLFGLDDIVAFTHKAENVLDRVRNNEQALNEELIGLFLGCRDHIERLLDTTADGVEMDADIRQQGEVLASRLSQYMGQSAATLPTETEAPLQSVGGGQVAGDTWHLSLRFGQDVLKNGMDPLSFIRYLGTLGEIVHLSTLDDALPDAAGMDPECCYLGFEIRLRSGADKARIESVFEFVRDDCQLHILPPGSRLADYINLIEALPENNARLGEMLVACGAVTQRELDESLALQECESARQETLQPLGEIMVERQIVQPELVDAALSRQKEVRHRQSQEARFIRVHADKLDSLINLVGELVIAGAGVGLMAARNKDGAMMESVSGMARLVEDIRDGAMRLRMVEIGETFNRFRRVVRDVSKEIGKDIELSIGGAETELDKTVVDKIGDPLTHLVRNAMDHGIESADVRLSRGKPAKGTLQLNAYHESGGIVIEVVDDGGGLNRERILAKARDKGLIQAGDNLADRDVWNLIFEPGFSTAEQVSNLSGRGVGMDVVRRNIEALRGTVEIESREGVGSTFRIRLPLTLAIIDGFLMGVAESHYVVPLDMVLECVELSACANRNEGCDYLNLRGEVLPLLRVKDHFKLKGRSGRRENVVVVTSAGRKAGLVVDELKGEFQAVIKPLGTLFERIRGISGSTILGSGEVALVLDVPALQDEAARAGSAGVTA
ncbi:chemotaxis protein CheA [Thiobacillus sp.]|uniref:chemotaxis protein CheA n=1 Tax=Thiobacillus sp. TaxID=924 RepID=UPI00286E2C30|nr:chemotaxis protein CheA [Thiobacillus sp.]